MIDKDDDDDDDDDDDGNPIFVYSKKFTPIFHGEFCSVHSGPFNENFSHGQNLRFRLYQTPASDLWCQSFAIGGNRFSDVAAFEGLGRYEIQKETHFPTGGYVSSQRRCVMFRILAFLKHCSPLSTSHNAHLQNAAFGNMTPHKLQCFNPPSWWIILFVRRIPCCKVMAFYRSRYTRYKGWR